MPRNKPEWVNGLPTISFSPYGAIHGPTIAKSTTSAVMVSPTISRRWDVTCRRPLAESTLMRRSPSSRGG